MSALFRIIYAAHANGTHHKLALDALNHMQRPDAEAWRRVILKNIEKYLEGSKAPDNTFKDFKNHVLHVGENYWGGAPEKVVEWYSRTVEALRAEQWSDAAYAAGVMSHYYTDPCMPFHTGQTEAENSIHRATEWSINRSYNKLRKIGEDRYGLINVPRRTSENWLKEMTCDGAESSHRYYEKLIAHYNLRRGVVVPEEGLDEVSQNFVAELLIYAAEGFGILLDRAFGEADVAPPDVGLTLETFIATLKIPSKWIEKKLSNAEDRKLVQAMYDELQATGRVDATLTEDDRTIRDLHAAEVLAPKLAKRSAKRAERVPVRPDEFLAPIAPVEIAPAEPAPIAKSTAAPEAKIRQTKSSVPVTQSLPRYEPDIEPVRTAPATATATVMPSKITATPLTASATPPTAKAAPVAANPAPIAPPVAVAEPEIVTEPVSVSTVTPMPETSTAAAREQRTYLAASDPLEDAPSIGPKMAERFALLGIHTVADFIGHDPHDMAELLDDNRFDGEVLADWQDQAQLVMDIPGLRGGGAQLLVGAGYRSIHAIAEANPVDLSADVLTFAVSSDGKRILRDGTPPDLEKIKTWVASATEALAA